MTQQSRVHLFRVSTFALLGLMFVSGGCQRASDDGDTSDALNEHAESNDADDAVRSLYERLATDKVIKSWSENPELEWDAVIALAELSELAYRPREERRAVLAAQGFTDVMPLETATKSGFIAMSDGTAVVVFRGTAGKLDWLANGDFRQLRDGDTSLGIHVGFRNAYNNFDVQVRKFLHDHNPKRVWVTGHSLGGAMAACCAYALLKERLPISGVVTFGQPRIGNEAVAAYLDKELGDRYLRVINALDPVPILPPSLGRRFPSYWHTGRRIWFLDGEVQTTQGPAMYAEPGSPDGDEGEEIVLDETEGADESSSISEEDFVALQQQLREAPSESVAPATEVEVYGANSSELRDAVKETVLDFFRDRIKDHGMESYLNQLREHLRNINAK